jgi:outer membrane protein
VWRARPFLLFMILRTTLVLLVSCASLAAAEKPATRPVLRLTLHKAIELALSRNFSIEVQHFEPEIARQQVIRELGRFDPVLDISAGRTENSVRNTFNGIERLTVNDVRRGDSLSIGVGGISAWGTTYDLRIGADNSLGTFNGFNDNFTTDATISLRQPLLQGAGADANLAQLRIARNNVLVSEWQMRDRVIAVVTDTITAYNDLHLAQESLRVATGFRDLARRLVAENSRKLEVGTMIPLDVTQAQAEAASREEAVILAQRAILDTANFLKQLVTRDIERMLDVTVEIAPPNSPPFKANVNAAIADALTLRPDYRQAKLDIERRNITLAFTRDQAQPRLDLTASLSLLGFAGDLDSSVGRVPRRDSTGWTVGAIFSVPVPNREGRGAVVAAQLSAAQSVINLQRIEQQIVVDVDNASGAVTTSRQRIESTQVARKLAAESSQAADERLRIGQGRTFEALELQKRLAEAEFAELRAQSDYNKAVAQFDRQTGTTLRVHRVVIEEPR